MGACERDVEAERKSRRRARGSYTTEDGLTARTLISSGPRQSRKGARSHKNEKGLKLVVSQSPRAQRNEKIR